MRNSKYLPVITGLALFVAAFFTPNLSAQYVYPLNLELPVQEDALPYFFRSAEFSPLQTGAFSNVARQFSDQPLAAINRNPAEVTALSGSGYFYADFKTLPEATYLSDIPWPCSVCAAGFNYQIPTYKSRQTEEPSLSTAVFFNPLENSPLWLGFTYQFLKINESYYDVTRPVGVSLPVLFSDISSINFFTEKNYFNKTAHFPSLYAGYALSGALSFGLKLSYNVYSGNGNSVNEDFAKSDWERDYDHSFWRAANYRHWDLSGGLKWKLNDRINAGISAGFLTGNFDQSGNDISVSNIFVEQPSLADDNYSDIDDSKNRSGFDRDGNTYYSSATLNWQLSQNSLIRFIYNGSTSDQDFGFGNTQTNYRLAENEYLNFDEQLQYHYQERYRQISSEAQGTFRDWRHDTGVFFTRDFGNGYSLTTGLQLQMNFEKQQFEQLTGVSHQSIIINQIGDEPEDVTEFNYNDISSTTVNERRYMMTGYVPVVLRKTFNQYLSMDLGVLAQRQNLINKYSYEGDPVYLQLLTNTRTEQARNHFNAFASVIVKPTDKVSFRVSSFTDRRQEGFYRNIEAFRFRFATEIHF